MPAPYYFLSLFIPILTGLGLILQGFWSFSAIVFAFIITPLLDQIAPKIQPSLTSPNSSKQGSSFCFDAALFINVPVIYGLILLAGIQWSSIPPLNLELIGQIISLGIVLGSNGINVAHELGHRSDKRFQKAAWSLLLPSFYLHFFVEHNHGHHRYVATAKDPATARYNETLYAFLLRSIRYSYKSAWNIQISQLEKRKAAFVSSENLMLRFTFYQFLYVLILLIFFPLTSVICLLLSGGIGLILLEIINYIEHYGLQRKPLDNGRFERVKAIHSWNADYSLGRLLLYDLTLHSDHHYLARKPYYTLESLEDAPMLPFGYPAAMLCSTIPPLWFSIMNPKIPSSMIDLNAT